MLVDEDSASASEIVAACIRDNRRGKIVGRKTYGKGSVQSIYELRSVRGGLRLTTAKFWAKYKGRPIVLSGKVDFLEVLWSAWEEEAKRHGHDVRPGDQACWGGIMVCAETDEKAWRLFEDMKWFWETWAMPFGQGFPELLVGSPDTLNKRIEEVSKAVPIDEAFLLIPQGLHTPEQITESLDLFARKVMPNWG